MTRKLPKCQVLNFSLTLYTLFFWKRFLEIRNVLWTKDIQYFSLFQSQSQTWMYKSTSSFDNIFIQDSDFKFLSLEGDVRLKYTSEGTEQHMLVLPNPLKHSLQALKRVTIPSILIRSYRSVVSNCFRTVPYYCANIRVAKPLCTVKHGLIVPRPFHRCRGTLEDFGKMTQSNLHHSLRTDFFPEEVQKFWTKINLLENWGELHQVRLLRKIIEDNIKNYSSAR